MKYVKSCLSNLYHQFRLACYNYGPYKRFNITSSQIYRYTWFRVAKNGTRSLLSVLLQETKPEIHGSWIRYKSEEHVQNYKFCFIRNPWDRLVSCYEDKVINQKVFKTCVGKDFDFFVHWVASHNLHSCDRHFRLQCALFPAKEMDFIGRFEHFEEDSKLVLDHLSIQKEIPHLNKSKHKPYTLYYNSENRDLVGYLYQKDIQLGGYRFGE